MRGEHCHDADRRLPCEAFCDTGEIFLIMFYRVLWYTNQDLWEYQAKTHSLTKSTRRSVKTTHGSARRYTSQSANHRVRKLARMGLLSSFAVFSVAPRGQSWKKQMSVPPLPRRQQLARTAHKDFGIH